MSEWKIHPNATSRYDGETYETIVESDTMRLVGPRALEADAKSIVCDHNAMPKMRKALKACENAISEYLIQQHDSSQGYMDLRAAQGIASDALEEADAET